VPPPASTLRARTGLILIRVVNRIVWWPLVVGQRVASALIHVVRVHREEQIKLHQSVNLQITQFAAILHERNLQFQSLSRAVEDLNRNHVVHGLLPRLQTLTQEVEALSKRLAALEKRTFEATAEPYPGIRHSRRTYVPLLRNAGVGTGDMPVLDLGCGRGEWLELLRQEGMAASGVDPDPQMVAECTSAQLRAFEADPLSYLSSSPAASIGAVTSFHVEHWPIHRMIALVDQAFRVLKAQGLLILESPSAAVPPDVLRHIVETCGFQDVRRLELPPYYAIIGARP
jgi:SAM-dependent methyltransferase